MKNIFLVFVSMLMGAIGCSNSASKDSIIVVNNNDFAKILSDTSSIPLIDVRTPAEYSGGHIPNAINIDISGSDFDSRVSELDKNEPVAVYCRSGKRSNNAAQRMVKLGFVKIYDLQGGIVSWNGKVVQ